MHKSTALILSSITTLAYLTGCGTDKTIPVSVITGITDNDTVARGATLNLDGSLSSDDVKIINYTWTIGDDIVSNSATDALTVSTDTGSYKLCLTTEDEDGNSNKTCKTINIIAAQETNPTAIINSVPTSGWKTKCNITLNANASQAGFERDLTSYKWFKDGVELGNDINQRYVFDTDGDHNITLEVTDDQGLKDRVTKTVEIAEIGRPTVKLTMLNPLQKEVFSIESSDENKTFGVDVNDKNLPYRGSLIFLSAADSFDDCNLTDDNLTYIWDGRIFDSSDSNHTIKDACFSFNPWLKDVHRDFNTTGEVESQAFVKRTDIVDLQSNYIIDEDKFNNAKYIYPYVKDRVEGVGGPYVFFPTCSVIYDRLEIELTVIDNPHGTQTYIKKTIEIQDQN